MTRNLQEALKKQKKTTLKSKLRIVGTLGLPIGGVRTVEVPNRRSFVYVKLRDNQSEVIQAFNNTVAPSYGLPVIVERQNARYVVVGVDTIRYQNNWNSNAPFLPRHGNTHSFDPDNSGGGDVVWVHSRQFMPSLIIPSGSLGAPNVVMASYTIRNPDGSWKYVGNTGTSNLTPYKPSIPTGAVIALVYLDSVSGNPYFVVGSGSYFPASITGTAQIIPYIPSLPNFSDIPLAAVRLVTGTSTIGWDNIYDLRQFLHTPTGTAGGTNVLTIWDEGIPQGTATILNFVGNNVDVSVSGTVARVFVTGSTGGGTTNLTGTSIGLPLRVVGTSVSGYLEALKWLGWDNIGLNGGFLDFAVNNTSKESNAGRIGYEFLDSGYLNIVGAGTVAGSRNTKFYDNVLVSSNMNAASYTLPSIVSQLISTDGSGNFVGSENYAPSGTYGRRDKGWVSVTPENGWIFISENWTRTGNLSFAVVGSGDLSSKYRKGTKIKYNDPALEYGVVGSVAVTGSNTYINLISNTDFAMANAFISGRYISYIENPEGFPHFFNWNANPQGFSVVPSSPVYRWRTSANNIFIEYVEENNGTSNATSFTATAPIAPAYDVTGVGGTLVDSSALLTVAGRVVVSSGSTTITFRTNMAVGAWTNSGGKRAVAYWWYEF